MTKDEICGLLRQIHDVLAMQSETNQVKPVAWMSNKDFEPIRIRIMQEAYNLADRNDSEGYNAIKVMCSDVQKMLPPQRTWVGLTDEEIYEIYTSAQEEVNEHWDKGGTTKMFPLTLYKAIEAKLKEKNSV